MRRPRIALFADSYHEANGVARTTTAIEACAKRSNIPLPSIHAGPETRNWSTKARSCGSISNGQVSGSFGLEHDLRFDPGDVALPDAWRRRFDGLRPTSFTSPVRATSVSLARTSVTVSAFRWWLVAHQPSSICVPAFADAVGRRIGSCRSKGGSSDTRGTALILFYAFRVSCWPRTVSCVADRATAPASRRSSCRAASTRRCFRCPSPRRKSHRQHWLRRTAVGREERAAASGRRGRARCRRSRRAFHHRRRWERA